MLGRPTRDSAHCFIEIMPLNQPPAQPVLTPIDLSPVAFVNAAILGALSLGAVPLRERMGEREHYNILAVVEQVHERWVSRQRTKNNYGLVSTRI